MMEIFDKVNMSLLSSATAKIHMIHGAMTWLLRRILSLFVQQREIGAAEDLAAVLYTDGTKQLPDDKVHVSDAALALLCHFEDNGEDPELKQQLHSSIWSFHEAFADLPTLTVSGLISRSHSLASKSHGFPSAKSNSCIRLHLLVYTSS